MITDRVRELLGLRDDYKEDCHPEFNSLSHPYDKIDISIIVPSLDISKFAKLVASFGTDFENSEILVKIDDCKNASVYQALLEASKFAYKIIIYPPFKKKWSCQHFYNDMAALASGKMIWKIPEDGEVLWGHWYSQLLKHRDVTFQDNIYCIGIPTEGMPYDAIPGSLVVTKEWLNVLGILSVMPNNDRWLWWIAKEIGRLIHLSSGDLFIRFPKGNAVMSRRNKSIFFKPAVEKAIEKFKAAIK
tara:strand:+ start:4641 stop:5375 length:735 start_codon:yes stop_codon:yes gene_type:complete